jgi:type VI secretion system protein ImpL
MSFIKRVFGLIFNRWTLIAGGIAVLLVLIWWVGPMIAINNVYPFQADWVRWLETAIVVLVPIARGMWGFFKARRANARLRAGLVQPTAADARPGPASAEVLQLRKRFDEALEVLRNLEFGGKKPPLWARLRSLGSRQYLYELPWYVFIGAPGAGKTTALVNSGLRFPLAEQFGQKGIRGVGGTRNCDWWFTEEAVFLDTAGRYTTQESDRDADAAAWKGFLQLLKRSRTRRPINGVLATVSVGDLLQQSAAETEAQAKAIRTRVHELHTDLGIRFPVYLLVTKSDLLAGFTEFFASLGKEERAQVWGCSLGLSDKGVDTAALLVELERLERRLYERLPERLEEERDPARRSLIYGFPQQFALLRERLIAFVEATFAPSRFETAPRVRGVYFTSGTQEGSPIDRVIGAVARGFGLERGLLPAQRPSARSYFLTRLLREVVFAEAGLAGLDLRWERRRRRLRSAAIAAASIVVVVATAAWSLSYLQNQRYVADVAAQAQVVKRQVAALLTTATPDVSTLLPALTRVQRLWQTPGNLNGSAPWSWHSGLYQGPKLQAASRVAYRRMLADTFLPSIAVHLDDELRRAEPGAQDDSYDTLKTYLMLYDPKHFDRQAVWQWLEAHAEHLFPGADPDAKSKLRAHFDALYQRGWVEPSPPQDEELVAGVRAAVRLTAVHTRVYERLKREKIPDLRDFTVAEKGGPTALLVFARVSGEPLTTGVPALYTKDAYYRHIVPRVDATAFTLAEEEIWVLGTSGRTLAATAATAKFGDLVRNRYLDDYRAIWRQFLGDITVIGDRDLTRSIEVVQILSGPDTPLKPLMKAIARETTLSVPPEGDLAATAIRKALGAVPGTIRASLEKTLVDAEFERLHRFVNGPGGNAPAPIDALLQQLAHYSQTLAATRSALDAGQTPPVNETAIKLRAEGQYHPEPIRSVVQALIDGGHAAGLRKGRANIDAELRAQVGDFCTKAISGRYPFFRTSTVDVPPDDFARLFSPGGLLDTFFQKHLAQHVDTSGRPWQFKEPGMGESAALAQFQRAQTIREVLFRGGPSLSPLQLELRPLEMDASIRQLIVDVDGKVVQYPQAGQEPVRVQFPSPSARGQIRLSISPPPLSGSADVRFEGPWALLRMVDAFQGQPTRQPERFLLAMNVAGRRGVLEVLASSVQNPLRLPELSQFRCPTAL